VDKVVPICGQQIQTKKASQTLIIKLMIVYSEALKLSQTKQTKLNF